MEDKDADAPKMFTATRVDPETQKTLAAVASAYFLAVEMKKDLQLNQIDNVRRDLDILTSLLQRRIDDSGILGNLYTNYGGFKTSDGKIIR